MRIVFESGHVFGHYPDGRLTVRIAVEDDALGQSVWDDIEFEVPPDFHSHNDSVAAALMTLAGRNYDEVSFNFPISAYCGETLRRYYGEVAFDPVDPLLEPRQRGSRLGLLFSGGVDSTATWIILNQILGDDFAVITSAYGGYFEFEARGYTGYRRDVSCRTNLRQKGWNRAGRFNFAVPLLFADYLDLSGVCTGHTIAHPGTHLGSLRHGGPKQWTAQDLTAIAGGLDELHVLRSLTTVAANRIFMRYGRDRLEAALLGCEHSGDPKRHIKEVIARMFYEQDGLPIPDYLRDLGEIKERVRLGATGDDRDHRVLYLLKQDRREEAMRICPGLRGHKLSALDGLALTFLERYSTNVVELLPLPLRTQVMDVFHECGIQPYDERDQQEVELVVDVLMAAGARQRTRAA